MTGPSFGVGGIRWGWFVVGALALVLWPAVGQTHTATLLLIWALFALSLGLLWGFAGLLSFGHAAYFGLGAYTYAIASTNIGESTGPLLLAILLPAIVAAVIGAMMFYGRISDVYMGVITLVVTLILFKFMNATAGDAYRIGSARLGGFNGIPAFPILNVPGDPSTQIYGLPFYYLVVVLLLLCYLLSRWILGSFFGRVLIGIRENEARVELLGYSAPLYKTAIFAISAAMAAPRGLPVRQLGRDRHARRVQLGPVGRGDRVDDRRRPWHAGRPDIGRHRSRCVQAAAGPADGGRQLPGARRDPGADDDDDEARERRRQHEPGVMQVEAGQPDRREAGGHGPDHLDALRLGVDRRGDDDRDHDSHQCPGDLGEEALEADHAEHGERREAEREPVRVRDLLDPRELLGEPAARALRDPEHLRDLSTQHMDAHPGEEADQHRRAQEVADEAELEDARQQQQPRAHQSSQAGVLDPEVGLGGEPGDAQPAKARSQHRRGRGVRADDEQP